RPRLGTKPDKGRGGVIRPAHLARSSGVRSSCALVRSLSAAAALLRNCFLDVLLADGLQFLVLLWAQNFRNCGAFSLWMAWSCFIFCIPESEGSFLIASNFGASAFRMGRTSTSCCGVSFSCCAKAITFASASGFWAGAAGARIRKARRQATDVRSVKSFLMFALCLFTAQLAYGT